jgi:hypothetical protein
MALNKPNIVRSQARYMRRTSQYYESGSSGSFWLPWKILSICYQGGAMGNLIYLCISYLHVMMQVIFIFEQMF